jgi:polysaccharide biosynthesis protein PslH
MSWLKSNRLEHMKKIAAIVPYTFLPAQSGGQKLISGFYQWLGKETELHVIGTPGNEFSSIREYQPVKLLASSRLRYADIFAFFRLKNYLTKHKIEWLIIEHPYLGWLAWLLKISTGVKLIVHTHNMEYQRFRSIDKWWWPLLKQYERWVLKKADLVFCITEEDKAGFIKELNIESQKCFWVPYGIPQHSVPIDKEKTKQSVCGELNIDSDTKLLFFNGVLNYQPNMEALDVILQQINPILLASNLNYKILIAGKNLPASYNELKKWNEQHVQYLGFVEDIDRYTKAADVLLNPVQSGGGVKTKMIEALGLNTTVVSTETGAAGVAKEVCGEKLIVVPDNDWPGFAAAVLKAINSNLTIPDAFYREFSWKGVAGKVMDIIH